VLSASPTRVAEAIWHQPALRLASRHSADRPTACWAWRNRQSGPDGRIGVEHRLVRGHVAYRANRRRPALVRHRRRSRRTSGTHVSRPTPTTSTAVDRDRRVAYPVENRNSVDAPRRRRTGNLRIAERVVTVATPGLHPRLVASVSPLKRSHSTQDAFVVRCMVRGAHALRTICERTRRHGVAADGMSRTPPDSKGLVDATAGHAPPPVGTAWPGFRFLCPKGCGGSSPPSPMPRRR
jgi:hypothetical protein